MPAPLISQAHTLPIPPLKCKRTCSTALTSGRSGRRLGSRAKQRSIKLRYAVGAFSVKLRNEVLAW